MTWLDNFIYSFWFFLPAGLANMFPIFAAKVPFLKNWDYPLDFHLNFRGKRILGPNKTIRGLAVGVIVAMIVSGLLRQPVMLGFLLGLGAIVGDAVESFFKRQFDIPAGQPWYFFDQIDYILGGILLTFWYMPLTLEQYFYVSIIYFALHLVSTASGYAMGLKQTAV